MTATAIAPLHLTRPPTAADIDRLAVAFLALEEKAADAYKVALACDEPHEQMKERLILLVEEFGSVHAEKSKLLHGIRYEMMATFGISTATDAAAVKRFADALNGKHKNLIRKMFQADVRYTLRPEAAAIVRGIVDKRLLALFSQCQVLKARQPTLKVRSLNG